mmetsp:Transcript_36960/g.68467  ORF Transcript_36960/g.68467 Transcript_36960/m.68467 type:complete len:84 (+) Transcript_36960:211-462(+)
MTHDDDLYDEVGNDNGSGESVDLEVGIPMEAGPSREVGLEHLMELQKYDCNDKRTATILVATPSTAATVLMGPEHFDNRAGCW